MNAAQTSLATPAPWQPFIPLAAQILGLRRTDLRTALAQLLEAASRGVGQLPKAVLDLPPGTELPAEFFATHGDLILLPRYAAYWQEVRQAVEAWWDGPALPVANADAIRGALDAILPPHQEMDASGRVIFDNAQQRLAVAALIDRSFGVLTGGPGTGKTTSAAVLLAVRRRLDPTLAPDQVIITAPTGKAACRLAESLARAADRLPVADDERAFLRALRPVTLHRALEWTPIPPERGGPFRRGRSLPLAARVVLVDEASMMDLTLMAHLVRAMPQHSSLWLLGDSDQLTSVETGGVLAELVERGSSGPMPTRLTAAWTARLGMPAGTTVDTGLPRRQAASPLPGLAVGLVHSFRAKNAPWVLDLASCARPGAGSSWEDFLATVQKWSGPGQVRMMDRRSTFHASCCAAWRELGSMVASWSVANPPASSTLQEVLRRFQLLCGTNAQVEHANRLGLEVMWGSSSDRPGLPHGTPVMVTVNRPALHLSNGDIGIALGQGPGPAAVVAFPGLESPVPILQLPAHQPAFALTIHKSQGSEWQTVAIDLGLTAGDLVTRNLVYTAITRASGGLEICTADMDAWKEVFES